MPPPSPLASGEPIPEEYLRILGGGATVGNRFISLTRTDEEVSLVLESEEVENADAKWSCIKIRGPLLFPITGMLCHLTQPLKAAMIPVLTMSTWNTDYVLVPKDLSVKAVEVLAQDRWRFVGDGETEEDSEEDVPRSSSSSDSS